MKKLLIAALSVAAVAANAQVLWGPPTQQVQGTYTGGFISMDVTENPAETTILFDDVVAPVAWNITRIIATGTLSFGGAVYDEYHFRFSQNASHTNPGTIGRQFSSTSASVNQSGVLNFDLGAGVELGAGTWWLSVWAEGNFTTNGQWNWSATENVTGNAAVAHNPGGAILGVTEPTPIHVITGGQPLDLRFEIQGAPVPEPGTFIAIGLGLAGLALARRRK